MGLRFRLLETLAFCLPRSITKLVLRFDADLLRNSFNSIARPRIHEYSPRFYENFFRDYPEVVPLFGRNMVRPELDTRINHFMLFIVDNSKNPRVFLPFVRNLAARHRKYGVSRHHYQYVCETNIKTLREMSNGSFTEEMEREWRHAFGVLSWCMQLAGGYAHA